MNTVPAVDLVRIGIGVVAALLLCTLRLRLVLWADTLYSVIVGGVTIYNAKDFLRQSFREGVTVNVLHEYLLCTRVILLLMPSLTWLFCRATVDITCRTAITLSRLVAHLGAAIFMAVEHFRVDSFTHFHLLYCLLPSLLWALVMLVQLIRTGSRVNIHIRRVDINKFLTIDLFLLLLSSAVELTGPRIIAQYLNRQVDEMHVYLHRMNGFIYMGLSCIPWIGQRFRYNEDKHTVLLARELAVLLWFGCMGYAISQDLVPLDYSTYAFMGHMSVLMLPCLLGTVVCSNGPFTAAFWTSPRKNVNSQGPRRQ